MDVELLSSGGREAIAVESGRRARASGGVYTTMPSRDHIVSEARQRGITPILPPLAPFHSNEWPWRTKAAEARDRPPWKTSSERDRRWIVVEVRGIEPRSRCLVLESATSVGSGRLSGRPAPEPSG